MTQQEKVELWAEFRNAQLLWWINRSLHIFGWSLVVETDDNGYVKDCYPAKTSFRGFDEQSEDEGFTGLTRSLSRDIQRLLNDVNEK